ncbi:hypothetical protein D3C77_287180 [compost metagenome]
MRAEQYFDFASLGARLLEQIELAGYTIRKSLNQLRMNMVAVNELHVDAAFFRLRLGTLNITANAHNRIMRGKDNTNRFRNAVLGHLSYPILNKWTGMLQALVAHKLLILVWIQAG